MSCKEILPLLSAHVDSALEADDREIVEKHLATCAKCRDQELLIKATAVALRENIAARPMPDFAGFADQILARSKREKAGALEQAKVWSGEMFHAHRAASFGGIGAAAFAACAALALVFTPMRAADDEAALGDNSPQVEEVDFGTHDGAVLQLPRSTTVIWMSDDRGAEQ